ncbi:hypothetical protein [Streptomyces mirabilis]|uniref:hypothetical protein n=1 Tax=Streptomyces mirabilis TaxID=68239 RepID=UPI0035E16FAE
MQQCREVVQSAQAFGVRLGPSAEVAEHPPCEEHGVIRSARESVPTGVREQAPYDLLKPAASARPRGRHLVHPQTIGVRDHRGRRLMVPSSGRAPAVLGDDGLALFELPQNGPGLVLHVLILIMLTGPAHGMVELPLHIAWSELRVLGRRVLMTMLN